MEYTTLGNTGMQVSRIGLGGNTLGLDSSDQWEWAIGTDESQRIVETAIDLGINFFDTSNSYSGGDSEKLLGSVFAEHDPDEFVVSTKVGLDYGGHPNASGLSRKTIEQELQHSLDRLGIDTIDLYQIHRWDYGTPIDTTVSALQHVIRRGQVRYVGASSMWAHQFAELVFHTERRNFDPFSTMQNHYNLVYREEEREMLPFCAKHDIGVISWGSLAAGFLTRPHEAVDATTRGQTSAALENRPYEQGGGREINERVQQLAEDKDVSMAQVALGWVLHKDVVDVALVGATKESHVKDVVAALDIQLTADDLRYLEEPYQPVPVSGHE